jgi:hypothetical protein
VAANPRASIILDYTQIIFERYHDSRTFDKIAMVLCVLEGFADDTFDENTVIDTRFDISNEISG